VVFSLVPFASNCSDLSDVHKIAAASARLLAALQYANPRYTRVQICWRAIRWRSQSPSAHGPLERTYLLPSSLAPCSAKNHSRGSALARTQPCSDLQNASPRPRHARAGLGNTSPSLTSVSSFPLSLVALFSALFRSGRFLWSRNCPGHRCLLFFPALDGPSPLLQAFFRSAREFCAAAEPVPVTG